MTSTQQTQNVSGNADATAVHLMIKEGKVQLVVENPEQVIDELRTRAEELGSVLEGILLEPHGEPRWGLNE